MEIPGIAPFSGQPTLTNPLSTENQLIGRQSPTQQNSETASTTVVQEQESTSLQTTAVVNEVAQNEAGGFDPENPGGTIDITV
ncbi:hypothetical protein [Methylophaga nitratireducenticrescens]|uniref:Uncharacterized protein n=1 Tax=Methylophaga nitratireducenticrescens TaxID=754476 RepID=I1XFI4_METNJ|nr:hypothetical protein [Methylophaga nitratireducenticrescens]AFI83153.1 hypothetical protein Q7A_295 [Methylophaga nitratireducenticrescens]AUZ83295.1 hypothetical protein CDW43_01285 [Methylophaga nitratireducenticrescens]